MVQASVRFISSHVEYMPDIFNLYYLTYKVKHFGVPQVKTWQDKPDDEPDTEDMHEY